jgi:transcriptional regulator with XRE-family HTH domain
VSRRAVRLAMTGGRRALLAALQHMTARELARRVGCSPAALSLWRSGQRTPDHASRTALELVLPGCAARSWDEAASNVTPVNADPGNLEERAAETAA